MTAANVHDVTVASDLLTGEEKVVYGDSGYLGADKRPESLKRNMSGKTVRYKLNRRPSASRNNSNRSEAQIKRREHEISSVRAKVEHVFAEVLKSGWGRSQSTWEWTQDATTRQCITS